MNWQPLYLKTTYVPSDLTTHIVLLIVLPAGVCIMDTDDIVDLRVEEGNTSLVLEIVWPCWVSDLHFFGEVRNTDRSADDLVLLLNSIKQGMRAARPTKHAPMKAQARIMLGAVVKPVIEDEDWELIGEINGNRMLLVELKTPTIGSYEGKKVKSILGMQKDAPTEA